MKGINIINILRKCGSWQEFRNQLHSMTEKQKGDSFELLTKYYLKLNPEYITSLRNVWHLQEVPTNIKKKLNLPPIDEGIDLIAETKDGKYWAIQCKYRDDENRSLTRKELSTFTDLAFNICRNIELGLVCTNADRFSHKLTLYSERLSFCSGDVWRVLDKDFFSRFYKLLAGKIVPLKPISPRKHQKQAIKNAYKHFDEEGNSSGKLISPCGTGKSLTGYWIAEELGAKKILVAVPSLALIRQTLQVWTRETVAKGRDIHWIAVCSDESVGSIERDDIAVLTQDLGIRVHTDSDEIAKWLKARKRDTTVVFTTYQSGKATAEAAKKSKTIFDIGIFDEAHKTVGKKDSLFSYLLYDKNIPVKKRVFMTATERHYRGQSDEIVSMDYPEIYGDTFELLSFKKALESKNPILSDYKIVTISVTRSEIASLIKENLLVRPDKGWWDNEVEAEMLAVVIALRKAMKKYPIKHAVSFHSSIARAKAFKYTQDVFTDAFPVYGKLETFHVSGKTPTAVRSRELEEFAMAKRSLVTNARCLTEGVDVPNIDCVLFADPRKSTIDIVQAVGRALRTYEGKKMGYVIVPVLLDNDLSDIKSQQSRAFNSILMVLRALAANDERIIEYFRTISQGRKWTGGTIPVDIDIPEGLVIDADEFVESIKLQFWSRLAKLSWRAFEEAREFVRGLGLRSQREWFKYVAGDLRDKPAKPHDIPGDPLYHYKDSGWLSWGDWLGTGFIAPQLREYRPFIKAKKFVHKLQLQSNKEWKQYCRGELSEKDKKPDDIPAAPFRTYKDEWKGWGDWLGTGAIASFLRKYRSFEKARNFVRNLKLNNIKEWKKYCKGELRNKRKKPDDIPANPYQTYKGNGWINWGDWLGTGYVAHHLREFRPFKEARSFARKLGLKNKDEWNQYYQGKLKGKKKPDDIPTDPQSVYKDKGWSGWGDWLGTGTIAPFLREYSPFKEARKFVHSLGLLNSTEWRKYCKGEIKRKGVKPNDIPADPKNVYKDEGWISMGNWLGTDIVAPQLRIFRPFHEAREFVKSLGLRSRQEWVKYCKGELPDKGSKPSDIPATPSHPYKNEWRGWGDWLGTGFVAHQKRHFQPFSVAHKFVRKLELKSRDEWIKYCKGELSGKGKKPLDIPAKPQRTYKNKGWISWGDWLGTGFIANQKRKFRPFKEARFFVQSRGLKSKSEWTSYLKAKLKGKINKPGDIPTNPDKIYKNKGWLSWPDWLGTTKKLRR